MTIPLQVDKTPNGTIVKRSYLGEPGYAQNTEYQIQITPTPEGLIIDYYGEDGSNLTDDEIWELIRNLSK